MNLSYWEKNTWLSDIDYAIIGSGIVGLTCALSLREKYPNSKIVIFERGLLPNGASTKNAGFACFGSLSEMIHDLKTHTEEELVALVAARVSGLSLLRNLLGDDALDFKTYGGYEVFKDEDSELYDDCVSNIEYINSLLQEIFKSKDDVFSIQRNSFGFEQVHKNLIFNRFEGQIDTGRMMKAFLKQCFEKDITILNNIEILNYSSEKGQVLLETKSLTPIKVQKLFIATNGFAQQFLSEDLKPARAQVLITKPIKNLSIKGTFHLDKGYYYFRNIHDRILLGGGRNLDILGETTTQMEVTSLIQQSLETLLHTTILPKTAFEIDSRWSGIMGVGTQKKPVLREVDPHVYCGIRLGGMGVAIGSTVGRQLANLESKHG